MRISGFIARRYLFSKNNPNAINIISGISVVGFAVGAMALVTVMSVFNGFEGLVQSLYNAFDPDLKIEYLEGKAIDQDSIPMAELRAIDGVVDIAGVLEENVALRYDERQAIATMKGVSENYKGLTQLDSLVYEGELVLKDGDVDYAVAGLGIAARLGLSTYNDFVRLGIYVPRKGNRITLNPESALNSAFVYPRGIFSIDDEINNKYILVPLHLAQDLLEYPNGVSSLEVKLSDPKLTDDVQAQIQAVLGSDYSVKNKAEQQETLYRVFRYEKWATALILVFIMCLLTFTVISSLTMLVMEKKRDIAILNSMGMRKQRIRNIFLREGILIALLGGSIGLALGFALCWVQQTYGVIGFGGLGTFIVNAYPVEMKAADFLLIFLLILALGFLTSIIPARRAAQIDARPN